MTPNLIFVLCTANNQYSLYDVFCTDLSHLISENFGKYVGNIAIICKTDALYKLVNASTDISLTISDRLTNQILYSNAVSRRNIPARENFEFFHKTEELPKYESGY